MDPRGFPTTLPEFQEVFPDDAACARYLERMRWPGGFHCPKCNESGEPYRFPSRSSVVLRCRRCHTNASLTASTVMRGTHTPLSTWFWGAYLVTTQTPGQSALQFQRQLGISRYETAFQILHKLRAGMVRRERDAIGGEYPVEVDECMIGGRIPRKDKARYRLATVIGAVEVRERKSSEGGITAQQSHAGGVPLKKRVYAGRLRLRVINGRDRQHLISFVMDCVAKRSTIRTDGCPSYKDLSWNGFKHEPVIISGDMEKADAHLPMIHLVFSNLKTWILGTHHGAIAQHHLQAYVNEYVYRFNRRFYPMTAFNSVLGIAAQSEAPTYKTLYSGEWKHPG